MLVNALSVALIVDCSSDDCQSVIWSSISIAGKPEGMPFLLVKDVLW